VLHHAVLCCCSEEAFKMLSNELLGFIRRQVGGSWSPAVTGVQPPACASHALEFVHLLSCGSPSDNQADETLLTHHVVLCRAVLRCALVSVQFTGEETNMSADSAGDDLYTWNVELWRTAFKPDCQLAKVRTCGDCTLPQHSQQLCTVPPSLLTWGVGC
jgi:hypothetical protein